MITWMQRHRKYLVVTMWISAIAFVGAGFVGWGQYSYGEKQGKQSELTAIRKNSHQFIITEYLTTTSSQS